MAEALRAMSMAGGILLLVVGLILVLSFAAVNRGEVTMNGDPTRKAWWNTGLAAATAEGAAAIKAAPAEEINVMLILGMGTAIFVLAVALLFGISVLQHM